MQREREEEIPDDHRDISGEGGTCLGENKSNIPSLLKRSKESCLSEG